MKKVIYIAGPITGVPCYWEAFEDAEDELIALGYIPLSPAHMPSGLEREGHADLSGHDRRRGRGAVPAR